MTYTIIRTILTTAFGVFSGYMTIQFTKKRDKSGEYSKKVGSKIAAAKVLASFLIGVLWQWQVFPLLRGPIISLIVGIIGIAIVYNKLFSKKSIPMLLFEFLVVGLVCELLGTYLLGIWF
jgi:hypothetical protein